MPCLKQEELYFTNTEKLKTELEKSKPNSAGHIPPKYDIIIYLSFKVYTSENITCVFTNNQMPLDLFKPV